MKDLAFVLRRLSTILAVVLLTLTLIAAITGILLAFYYEPAAGGAYQSLKLITDQVTNGWLVRTLHDIAGNGVIVVALIQIVVMFLGERLRPSWLTAWISGILFTLVAIALSWTAIILDWSQIGFWRFKVELGTIEAIPLIGSSLRQILTGGGAVGTLTVAHMYTLHSYVLAMAAVGLAIVHLAGLLLQEREIQQEPATTSDCDPNTNAVANRFGPPLKQFQN
ncbi:cytochrome b N-terminal domain-containing protein [Leptothermofonsia sp. ETS-13]|uniref:cytochrome b N-terminal domain-containing protein n=1 Tax=Leptothermofonsia sp. ETS-13 TaxID=3035696 RepID=UPI003BA3B177